MADGHQFSAAWRVSQRLLDQPKSAIITYPMAPQLAVIPSEFRSDLFHQKARVPVQWYSIVCMILRLAIGTVPACDRQTGGQTTIANTVLT